MLLLLSGIALSFVLPFLYISPPSLVVCIFHRIGIWFSVSLTFGAILVKVVRVYRIFVSKGNLTHVRFTEPHYQVIFTTLIVAGQMLIVVASLGYSLPGVRIVIRRNLDNSNDFPVNILLCIPDHMAFLVLSISYVSIIVVAATVIKVLSLNIPRTSMKHVLSLSALFHSS